MKRTLYLAVTPDELELIVAFDTTLDRLAARIGRTWNGCWRRLKESQNIPTGAPHRNRERIRIRTTVIDE